MLTSRVRNKYAAATNSHISKLRKVSVIITRPRMVMSATAMALTSEVSLISETAWPARGGSTWRRAWGSMT